MPEPLEAELDLTIAAALRSVDELRRDIETALIGAAGAFEEEFARVTGSLPPVDVTADTGDLSGGIEEAVTSADGTVPIEGEGADQLTLDIDSAVSAADTTVEVDADLSGLDGALEDLQTRLDDVGASLEGVTTGGGGGGGIDGLGAVSGLATGSVSGLGAAVGGLGGSAAKTVGVIGAAGAAVSVFFGEAVDALGATQRFNSVLGDTAPAVEHLKNIEGLNTNLSELALQLGSDDDKIRTVAARLFELAQASGIARDDASLFTQQMIALGARAVAANPALGDVGDVTDALSTALVRGGRFASKFGLDLNAADINARALADTNKDSVDQLSFVEKAMAGAAIATEKYGGNLDTVIARGSENAVTQLRRLRQMVVENAESLGKPLVVPIFALMKEGIPVAEQVGRVLATVAKDSLPALIATLKIAGPVLTVVADVLDHIPGPLVAAAAAMLLFRAPVSDTTKLLQSLGGASQGVGDRLGRIAVGVGLAVTSFQQIGESSTQSAVGVAGLAASGALLGSQFGPQGAIIGGIAGAVVGLGKAVFSAGESIDAMRTRVKGLASELDGLSAKGAARRFVGQLEVDFDDLRKGAGNTLVPMGSLRRELEALARTDPAAARSVAEGIRDMGASSGLTLTQLGALDAAVASGSDVYVKSAANKRDAAAANTELAGSENTAALAAQTSKQAYDDYVANLTANVPTISGLFAEATKAQNDFQTAGDPKTLIANLAAQTQNITDFTANVQILFEQGFTDLAATLAEQGPAAAGALAQALVNAGPETAAAAEVQVDAAKTAVQRYNDYLTGTLAPELGESGKIAGFSAAKGLVDGLDTQEQVVFDAARQVGVSVNDGIGAGLDASRDELLQKAAGIGDDIEAEIRRALKSQSPSQVMADVGEDITGGLALGMRRSMRDVIREAEAITRAASPAFDLPTPGGGGAFAPGGGGLMVTIERMEFHGITDPAAGRSVGLAFGDALESKLTAKRALNSTQTGF